MFIFKYVTALPFSFHVRNCNNWINFCYIFTPSIGFCFESEFRRIFSNIAHLSQRIWDPEPRSVIHGYETFKIRKSSICSRNIRINFGASSLYLNASDLNNNSRLAKFCACESRGNNQTTFRVERDPWVTQWISKSDLFRFPIMYCNSIQVWNFKWVRKAPSVTKTSPSSQELWHWPDSAARWTIPCNALWLSVGEIARVNVPSPTLLTIKANCL